VYFRRSKAHEIRPGALAAWLRKGELEAHQLACGPYDPRRFEAALRESRRLTVEAPDVFCPELARLCAAAGVATVFVPELRGAPLSGATRWLSPARALIQLSLRYKTNDQLWFSFFHEAGHLLLHSKREIFLDGFETGDGDRAEEEANRFAANLLIPPEPWEAFTARPRFSKQTIRHFAGQLGIAAGIVVGRLQHEMRLPYTHCNDLKVRLKWAEPEPS
jgi:hypothetical protein